MTTEEAVEILIRRTRTERGLPRKITDPAILAKFADILAAGAANRRTEEPAHTDPTGRSSPTEALLR